jgi:hypothetical protein
VNSDKPKKPIAKAAMSNEYRAMSQKHPASSNQCIFSGVRLCRGMIHHALFVVSAVVLLLSKKGAINCAPTNAIISSPSLKKFQLDYGTTA